MQPTTSDADLTLWTLLGEELDAAALPLPARLPDFDRVVAAAVKLAARMSVTTRPGARS